MEDLRKTEDLIEKILERYSGTRKSDHKLYRAYHAILFKQGKVKVSFTDFFTEPEKYNASNFATVERCRRKIQERRPELKDNKTAAMREYKQEVFYEYGR